MKGGEVKDVVPNKKYPKESSNAAGNDKAQVEDETSGKAAESEEDHEIETELNLILKKGPSKPLLLLSPPKECYCDLN